MKKIISVWSAKGGAGKTTIAINLAGCIAKKGHSVLLVDDDDPQYSAAWVAEGEKLPFTVSKGWPSSKPKEDIVVVDYSPRVDDLPVGDVVIVPIRPAALDLKSVRPYLQNIANAGKQIIEIVSQLDSRLKDPSTIAKDRQKAGALVVGTRSVYQRAIGEQVTIFDPTFDNVSGAREARKEILAIYKEAMKHE